MKGYTFNSEAEREEAEKWFAEQELPQEDDGRTLGGNRIVCAGDCATLARISDKRRNPFDEPARSDELDDRQARHMEQRALLTQALDADILTAFRGGEAYTR